MSYYEGVVVGKDKEWSACGLVMQPVRVRWSWLSEPRVDVFQTVSGNGTHWKIRYPEVAPPGARYELVVDEGPALHPEQEEVIAKAKAYLQELWTHEKGIQDKLLAMWTPTDRYGDAVAQVGGSRFIRYTNSISVVDLPFSIEVVVVVSHCGGSKNPYKVEAKLRLVDYLEDSSNRMTSINLPIVDGIASPTPLIEYLKASPFLAASRALSNIASYLSKAGG